MKIKILIALLIVILTISAVSATDDNITSDNLKVSEDLQVESSIIQTDEILSEKDVGTFSELSNLIKNTPFEATLVLDKDYSNSEANPKEITIHNSITIDGNGHTLDANKASRIFNIKSSNVILKNIVFKNGYCDNGGAIYFNEIDYYDTCENCVVDNCTFINCQAQESGAIHFTRAYMFSDGGHGFKDGCSNCIVNNSNFINCQAYNGGAFCFYNERDTGIINNCNFINCQANNDGGAIYFYPYFVESEGYFTYYYFNGNGAITNCNFLNCNANHGGAVYIGGDANAYEYGENAYIGFEGIYNSTVSNCDFIDCSANIGGSIYWDSIYGEITNSNFTKSYATKGGAVYAEKNIDLAIVNSNFKDNTALEFGSAIYGGVYCNCNFTENSNPEIYDSFNPGIYVDKNSKITYCPINAYSPRDTKGNISLYALDGNDYTFINCANITGRCTTIYFNSTQLGNTTIKAIFDTNYGKFESYENITSTCIEFEYSPYSNYLNTTYQVSVNLPKDAHGNLTLYVDNTFYDCVNVSNGSAIINFKTMKAGTYLFEAFCNCSYGFENASNEVVFRDGTRIYMWDENMFYNDAKKYSVSFIGIDGTPVPKNTIVNIKIGSTTIKTKTDEEGYATVNIPKLKPGKYTITAKYNNFKASEKLTVKHIVTLKSVTVKKSAKKLTLQATLKNKKPLKGKTVTFKFNGKTYKAKTSSKGIAKVTIKSSVLKKLKVGKKVTYQATYLKDTVKKTVKVKK